MTGKPLNALEATNKLHTGSSNEGLNKYGTVHTEKFAVPYASLVNVLAAILSFLAIGMHKICMMMHQL